MDNNIDMSDFLLQFRKRHNSIRIDENMKKVKVAFQLCFDEKGQSFIRVVDKEGNPVETDFRLYSGDEFTVLRSIYNICQDKMMDISWGGEDDRIYLKDYSYLLFQLIRCDNIVDKDMKHIRVGNDTMRLKLLLTKNDEEQVSASFGVMSDNVNTLDYQLVSDVFILVDNTIYPLLSVGENYLMLHFFEITFPEGWLENYLSVFFSYMENIIPVYDDYQLEIADAPIVSVPTLIFEKVDNDMALYMRIIQTIPGQDIDFIHNFDLLYIASLTMEHKIVLRRIKTSDEASENIENLRKMITGYAPDKKSGKEIYDKDDLFIIPRETAGPFLLGALPFLIKEYRIVGVEKLIDYKLKPVKPKINISLGSGINYLEGPASIDMDGEKLSLKKFLAQYKKNKYIELAGGERAIVDDSFVNRLERIFKKVDKQGDSYKVSFFDLPEVENLMQKRLEGEVFVNQRKVYEGFNNLKEQQMEFNKVNATLRDYQKEGVKWINYLYENKLGGCLADDMGLGKTLQTITMLSRIYPQENVSSLLVMPKSLLFNWQDEILKFAPQLSFYIYYGNNRDMKKARRNNIILTTYAMVRNDIADFSKQQFEYVILDESQNIKNVTSQTTQAVMLLQAEHRLALSGTPIENNLTELYSLFSFLNPTMFGTLDEFNRQYTYPIQRDNDKIVMESLRRRIFPFMLRRLKKDVLKELPDRTEQTLYVEMSSEQRDYYEQRRKYYYDAVNTSIKMNGIDKSQFVMFQALNELRRVASVPESLTDGTIASPKIENLIEAMTEAVSNGHKVVVFFNFIAGIELVGSKMDEFGIDFTTMTGSTHDRRSVIERFQNDPSCKVLLMTLKTGGVGLNLTVADTVFIFEPWWNKASEEQAINRLHRMGQKAKVMSYAMITQDTIEEKIRLLQQKKAELFEGLIGADNTTTKKLSEDDIQFILG